MIMTIKNDIDGENKVADKLNQELSLERLHKIQKLRKAQKEISKLKGNYSA